MIKKIEVDDKGYCIKATDNHFKINKDLIMMRSYTKKQPDSMLTGRPIYFCPL